MAETPLLHRRLTPDQRETLRVIDAFQRANGFPPTMREVQDALVLGSPSSALSRLETLRRYGLVDWRDRQFRTLHLTPFGQRYLAL